MGQLALCTAAAKNGKMLQRHMAKRTYSYSYYPGDIVRLKRGMAGSAFLAIEHGNILCAINSRNTLLGETFVVIGFEHGSGDDVVRARYTLLRTSDRHIGELWSDEVVAL